MIGDSFILDMLSIICPGGMLISNMPPSNPMAI